ncbi:hypothetical protein COY05_01030 [Candidatus Peregrinibacteria bacterium CG_4_10_14_0_2_um_filter_38_24]|nr:MAG: hypothetical protein COY05_01030 [Candidatus Peregrinibacteria bacterium CG_4_10_14_0_2_um_filter_38_24]PJC39015.1 MAG: hypothetical protein CO044_01945 [Candidatus Peregrinibacteria bacterium CG_4_9_14_0_2_um_filter_38_9]
MSQVSQQIVVDKNKTAEQYLIEAESFYIVPKLIREKFPDLIKLIFETESMNTEEREYWLQIMPIMSEDQITKFQGILLNEKNQLAKLDQEYATETESAPAQAPKFNEVTIKEKLANIRKEENLSKAGEQKEEEELFKHLQNL